MPKVPDTTAVIPMRQPQPQQIDPTALWMAAAMMHGEGKFLPPQDEPNGPSDTVSFRPA